MCLQVCVGCTTYKVYRLGVKVTAMFCCSRYKLVMQCEVPVMNAAACHTVLGKSAIMFALRVFQRC